MLIELPDPIPFATVVDPLGVSRVAADIRSLARTEPAIWRCIVQLDTFLTAYWPSASGPSLLVEAIEMAVDSYHQADSGEAVAVFNATLVAHVGGQLASVAGVVQSGDGSMAVKWDLWSAETFREAVMQSRARSFTVAPTTQPSLPSAAAERLLALVVSEEQRVAALTVLRRALVNAAAE